jgi:hypothetical protein
MSVELKEKNMVRRVYRVARREGYRLTKSRREISPQNYGDLMLIDGSTNIPALGWNYDATPEEVLDYFDVPQSPFDKKR